MIRLALAAAPLALLAACGDEAPTDDSRAATGEVLEGTISDAMLPVDRVRSQPPLAAPTPTAGSGEGGAAATPGAAADAAATPAAEGETPAEAETPGAEPTAEAED